VEAVQNRKIHIRANILNLGLHDYHFFATDSGFAPREVWVHSCLYWVQFRDTNLGVRFYSPSYLPLDFKVQEIYRHSFRLCLYRSGDIPCWDFKTTWCVKHTSFHYFRSSSHGLWLRAHHHPSSARYDRVCRGKVSLNR
jgi:hypothetical protein